MRSAPCDCNTRKGMRDCKATEDENRGETQRNVINESVAAETKDATRNGLDRRQRLRRSLCLSPGATEAGAARRHARGSCPAEQASDDGRVTPRSVGGAKVFLLSELLCAA